MNRFLILLVALGLSFLMGCEKQDPVWSNTNGVKYVDLGLPSGLKWAECNLGAKSPEEYGDYYAWGEIETKDSYRDWDNVGFQMGYKWFKNGIRKKYMEDYDEMQPEDDPARHVLGGSWRTPTFDEWYELLHECSWDNSERNGVKGYMVTGQNGKSIFLPAAGAMHSTGYEENYLSSWANHSVNDEYVKEGVYWSSTVYSLNHLKANALFICTEPDLHPAGVLSYKTITAMERYMGFSVRAVSR